jgi:hypothetical protein
MPTRDGMLTVIDCKLRQEEDGRYHRADDADYMFTGDMKRNDSLKGNKYSNSSNEDRSQFYRIIYAIL